ncbi:hypothetical protein Ae201684_003438 [Aphanomyces euteiches]|uniref:AB hydrolase-1 domain-containing protein n=1 Tax=Aphanomyces euteiches TaxID=100861 RepID=A0A6G0XLS0_9STRA|nr:hypothetical protein Ae201684_003438 [Aphanomyces euteiches]KAH9145932.1 hypothetical protein AeRB84_010161 [Aphanomyces euteiches]
MERKAMEVWRQVVEMAEKDRMVQKYTFFLNVLNYLHFAWTAKKPSLTYRQENSRVRELIRKCSLLAQKYHPTWYLFNNGHLHTIFLSMLESHPKINYQRQMVPLSDGGVVSLDWAIPPGVDPSTEINCLDVPTVVIFHGLTGGSGDNYVCVAVEKLLRHGWRVVVMNARGCAKTPVLTAKLFCGAYTNDVREVVACLRKNHVPTAPLISVGFSLGSNIMVKYIGEEGEKCQLTAAVSVGNPYDFLCNSRNMNFSFVHNLIYNGPLATNLKNLFFVRSNAHEHFSNHPEIDLEAIKASVRVSDFDEHLTRRAFGYASTSDYYRDASSNQYLKHIKIPLLLLTAKDDPICIHMATPYDDVAANPNIILAVTDTGGHLGFFSGNSFLKAPDMWSSNVMVEFCNAIDEKSMRKPIMEEHLESFDKESHVSEEITKVASVEDDNVSLTRVASIVLGLSILHFAIKHRHLIHKKWWH